jgi:hypothetical protein
MVWSRVLPRASLPVVIRVYRRSREGDATVLRLCVDLRPGEDPNDEAYFSLMDTSGDPAITDLSPRKDISV